MKWRLAVVVVVAAGQLGILAYMIRQQETTLREGQPYKFRAQPVNPTDVFRGGWVGLRFEQKAVPLAPGGKLVVGQRVFATLETDPDGFAKFAVVSATPPADQPYLWVFVLSVKGSNVNVALPFDRYYLEERRVPAAERANWQKNRHSETNAPTYAVVRVMAGRGVIEDLCISGVPVREFLRQHPSTK